MSMHTDGDNYYNQFGPKDTNNADSKPKPVSAVVKIGVLARFVLALFNVIRKK